MKCEQDQTNTRTINQIGMQAGQQWKREIEQIRLDPYVHKPPADSHGSVAASPIAAAAPSIAHRKFVVDGWHYSSHMRIATKRGRDLAG